ncbi:hypothetical protein BCR43DRAFT_495973 [Syncephalastrum racemosum]|uniref:Late endosomal/lysosomal adaptor and MAPK and MTOR activator 5 n=1 Tax=Syncephalastrum racemosum TaxID=13706 RepID=A0A1X2H6T5_SYNRA|nr:hypothetical protein BCR43DRAFT_495973 [Syncephalastrum racemosum]
MDERLTATLDSIANTEGVKGVLLADANGLCLGTRGMAKAEGAAYISSIVKHARALAPADIQERSQYPTVQLDYENTKVILRNEGSFTLAIFK